MCTICCRCFALDALACLLVYMSCGLILLPNYDLSFGAIVSAFEFWVSGAIWVTDLLNIVMYSCFRHGDSTC